MTTRRVAFHGFSALMLVAALVLAYLFGAKHGYEAGHADGYARGAYYGYQAGYTEALKRGYEAGAQVVGRMKYYLGVYHTCMSVNWELFYMPLERRIAACRRGVVYAYRQHWLDTFRAEGFPWPLDAEGE